MGNAAKVVQEHGFSEVNINCGCPSEKAGKGEFGACLMLKPELVWDITKRMIESVNIPVSVKCRLGVDNDDSYEFSYNFIDTVR